MALEFDFDQSLEFGCSIWANQGKFLDTLKPDFRSV
jgi:hypothetical protein